MSGVRDKLQIDEETKARQQRATDPAHSAWVTANAGSGKTYVLSRRVLRLLLTGADPGAVLCLTFTKAAAAQMQTRVFEELATWTQARDNDLATALNDLLGRSPDRRETQLARRLFARAIETPGRLKIQTIHAFCESVLQRFPFEARVPAGFTVLDDDMAQVLKVQARQDVLAEPGSDELAAALGRLNLQLDPDRFARLLASLTDRRNDFDIWLEGSRISQGRVRAHVAGVLGVSPGITSQEVVRDILSSPHLPIKEWTAIANALSQYPQASTDVTARLLRQAASETDAGETVARLTEVFWSDSKNKQRDRLLNAEAANALPAIAQRLEDEQARFLPLMQTYRAARIMELNGDLALAGDAVITRYERAKAERGMLDYADLIARTVGLLEFGHDAAWVLYKLDPGLDHILVDEAQDTSPDQWRVVRALTEEFFAGAGARHVSRTVFAVGDPKQSIYSFQGADPAGFLAMAEHFEARIPEDSGFETVELFRSFRTAPAVLEAVDHVFANAGARRGVVFDTERPVAHSAARGKAMGRVELWEPIPKPGAPDENPWDAPLDIERTDSAESLLARKIAQDIRATIDNEDILPSTLAPAQAGDFLILLRKRTRLAAPIIRALKAEGVPVAGADRLKLTDSIATLDLMALMRASLMPDDDYALACALKSPLFGLNDDDLMEIAIGRPGALADALHTHRGMARIETAAERFSELAGIARKERPFTFLAHVLGAEGGRLAYRERLGNEADDVLDELADRALAYERSNVPSVAGFLAWLERSGGEIKRDLDEGGEAVRVMTVHGAKGLEAPVVFVADTCSPPRSGQRDPLLIVRDEDIFRPPRAVLWDPGKALRTTAMQKLIDDGDARGEEEFHRLLYVAMTRAQDRLVICGAETGRKRDDGCWYNLVEAALSERLEGIGDGMRLFLPGNPGAVPTGKMEKPETISSEPLPGWARRAMEARPEVMWQAASSLGIGTYSSGPGGAEARRRGTLVHLLLEHLPEVAEDKRRQAGEALLKVHAHDWDEDKRETALGAVLALMNDPALAFLFSSGSRSEVPIAGIVQRTEGDETISVAGRIDRLVIGDNTITVADYKTGGPVPASPGDTPEPYVAQLAAYAALLGAIHPEKTIEAVLIWSDAEGGPAITRLPAGMLCGFEAADRLTAQA